MLDDDKVLDPVKIQHSGITSSGCLRLTPLCWHVPDACDVLAERPRCFLLLVANSLAISPPWFCAMQPKMQQRLAASATRLVLPGCLVAVVTELRSQTSRKSARATPAREEPCALHRLRTQTLDELRRSNGNGTIQRCLNASCLCPQSVAHTGTIKTPASLAVLGLRAALVSRRYTTARVARQRAHMATPVGSGHSLHVLTA